MTFVDDLAGFVNHFRMVAEATNAGANRHLMRCGLCDAEATLSYARSVIDTAPTLDCKARKTVQRAASASPPSNTTAEYFVKRTAISCVQCPGSCSEAQTWACDLQTEFAHATLGAVKNTTVTALDTAPRPVVLLVDDAPQELSLISEMLMTEYIVKVARDGEHGLRQALSDTPPDLILLDVMMAGIDGHEVCRQLKADARTRNIPVIFLTSRQEVADEQRGFELGAVDYIAKPISPPILLARVRTHIALRSAVDQLLDLNRFIGDSLDSLPDPTLVCDLAGKVMIANKAAARHFEHADLHGCSLMALMQEVHSAADQRPILPDIARAPPSYRLAREGQDPQGRHLLVRCVPSFAASGLHSGWILSLTDLTEMRDAERQRDQALRFLTHDLRDPQSSILTLLELYRTSPDKIPHAELLQRIERHAQRSLHLTDSYVQAARAESKDYHFVTADLNGLLDEAIDDAWAMALERDIEILVPRRPRSAPCLVDRVLVLRAISNLLSNAVKFSPAGGTVQCTLVVASTGGWLVSVQDHGPGIAPELQERLFQPYNRLHEGSHPAHGIGLGLAFVSTVAKRHGGSVTLQSKPGQGCLLQLHLPRGRSENSFTATLAQEK